MLVEFTVANYLSFMDPVTLSMVAGNIRQFKDTHLFNEKDLNLVKSAAIYGANASGKSNLCKAITFMLSFVRTSSKDSQIGEKIDTIPFLLNTASENKPSLFEIVFILDSVLYRYGFEITTEKIISEWLYYTNKKIEKLLFMRTMDNVELGNDFSEGKEWINHTRDNALFLSVVAQWKGKISTQVVQWITNNIKVVSGLNNSTSASIQMLSDERIKDRFIDFLKAADIGIEDIDIETKEIPKKLLFDNFKAIFDDDRIFIFDPIVHMFHNKYNEKNEVVSLVKFDLQKQESIGTRKLFSILAPIISALQRPTTLIIDELDSSLHPHLTDKIIEIFNSNSSNNINSQLIFNTHDTNLLSNKIFRRDQIWFVEKDQFASSHLYSLNEYKQTRSDEVYEKNYLKGKYGAIPYFGQFEFLEESKLND